MTGGDEEYITCTEPTKKKKKQKHDKSGKSIVKESQSQSNEKKKKKKKASVAEDALEIADVVPKKKKKGKALDEGVASCDLIINNVPKKKKKKKNVEDDVLESIDPLHKKEKHSAVEESEESVTKKKKFKQSKGKLEDKATKTQNADMDVSVSQKKKKKVSALEEESRSSKDDQSQMSDHTKAKKITKKKKTTSVPSEDDVIDGHDVHHEESLRVSKKKKKRKLSITDEKSGHGESDLNGSRDKELDIISDGASKKKNKNKAKHSAELAVGAHGFLHVTCCEEENQKSKKAKKKKMASVQSKDDVHHGKEDKESLRVSKKKKKRKLSITDETSGHGKSALNGNRDKEYEIISDGASKKKKRKKAKDTAELADGARQSVHVTCHEEEKQKSKMRKKEKMASVQSEDDVIDGHDVLHGEDDGESLMVSKKKKNRKHSITDKKSVHGESDLNRNRDNEYDIICDGASKKKKRNKAKETAKLADGAHQSVQVTCHEEEKSVRRKKEKMLKVEEHSASEDTPKVPKKKQKDKKETKKSKTWSKKQEEHTDIPPGPAQDEVHIDKGTKFGQWDTATFQNPEQQSKFLRLLGGFKKGNQGSPASPSDQGKANMALGKQGEQVLERNLQAEFDKALSWKENRGIGLGFQPAPNKYFYIDKTASRSVKFND